MPVCRTPFSGPCTARSAIAKRSCSRVHAQKDGHKGSVQSSAELALWTAVLTAAAAAPARADVDDAVNATIDAVRSAGDALKTGREYASGAASYLGEQYTKVSPKIGELVEKARPTLKQGTDELGKVAGPAVKDFQTKALPQLTSKTQEFLRSSGVDVDSLSRTAGDAEKQFSSAATQASPTVNKFVNFVTTSDVATLGKTAAAALALYFLGPPAVKALFSGLRGYSGDVSPARAVDMVSTDGDAAIIDIRSAREKEATGTPDVPSSAKGRFVELEQMQVERRLRGQIKSADTVESKITALEISYLKRVGKSSKILLIDKNGGGGAKTVAKELGRLGFRNVFVVTGGFGGWTQSKLQVRNPGRARGGGLPDILGTVKVRD